MKLYVKMCPAFLMSLPKRLCFSPLAALTDFNWPILTDFNWFDWF